MNWLAKIFKSVGTAKQVIKDHAEDFDNTKLLGRDMYDVLDKKAKTVRGRDIWPVTSDQPRSPGPFERDPRDAGHTPGGRSRPGNSGAETSRRTEADLVVDVGAASPNKANEEGTYSFEPLSVLNLVAYQKAKVETDHNNLHSAVKGLKLVEIEQKQMPFGGQNCKFSDKFGENYIGQSNSVIHQGFKKRIHGNPLSKESPKVTKPRGERKRGIESGNSRNVDKTSSGGCRSKTCIQKRPVSEFFICSTEKRRRTETNLQPEKPKQVRGIQSLQNGRVSSSKNHPKTKRLHVQGRSERRIFLCTNKPRSEEIPQICMAGGDPTVQKSTIWLGMRSIGLHQNYETPNRSIAAGRGTPRYLPGRHSDNEPIKRGINARQGFPDSPTSPSRVGDKLEKISHTTKPSNRILGIRTRLQGDGSITAKAKSRQNYSKMSRRPKFGPSYNTRTGKFGWVLKLDRRSSDPSSPLYSRTANASNKMPIEVSNLQHLDSLTKLMQIRDPMVDSKIESVEWETNSNHGTPITIGNGCIEDGMGVSLPNSESEDGGGGPWTKQEQEMHINALEMKAAGIAIKSVTRDKQNMHIHLKMDNVTAVTYLNKMGGTHSHTLNQIAKEILEYCTGKQIIITAEYLSGSQNQLADWESRNVKEISINSWRLNPKIFNQINKVMGPIMLDLFADRWSAQVPSYVSWDKDPLAVSTDAFLTNWGENKKADAFPPFCLIARCLSKIQKEGERS